MGSHFETSSQLSFRIEPTMSGVPDYRTYLSAARVRDAVRLCRDLFTKGNVIGRGAFARALRDHMEKGLRVMMIENAAYTVTDDLDEVIELGIEISSEPTDDFDGTTLTIEEINLTKLKAFLADFGETLSDINIVSIAV